MAGKGRQRATPEFEPSPGLTPAQTKAAFLIAQDDIDLDQVATQCGIHRATLWEWRQKGEFQTEVYRLTRLIAQDLIAPALSRLKRNIRHGSDRDANTAIGIALKAARFLEVEQESSDDEALDAAIDEAGSGD